MLDNNGKESKMVQGCKAVSGSRVRTRLSSTINEQGWPTGQPFIFTYCHEGAPHEH